MASPRAAPSSPSPGRSAGTPPTGRFDSDDFVAQLRQALTNIVAVLKEAGAGPEHLVRLTWYVTDKREYVAAARPRSATPIAR